jgi:alpha-1,4-digalacturonate transport system permease protein
MRMITISDFFLNIRGQKGLHLTDILTYFYLFVGMVLMFGPVLWILLSSFKTPAALAEFPPTFLPYAQDTVEVAGFDHPLPLYRVTFDDGRVVLLAQIRRVGIEAQLIDPAKPDEVIKVHVDQTEPTRSLHLELNNYLAPLQRLQFFTFFKNSVVVTLSATFITLIINSMAAFALSKYNFKGRSFVFALILSTLMVPLAVILVPVFWVTHQLGMQNSLLGIIIPPTATPTGVFLLRQYMLTVPDELLDAARVDGASEWRIYWQIMLPLTLPALAVLAIFSFMWRWNDFLWPLIILSKSELFTLQIGLKVFQGENISAWHFILAMTVLTLLPVTLVFAFLQRFITTGIASTGMKG